MQTYSLSPANIAIAVLKSTNTRHFGTKKPASIKAGHTHTITIEFLYKSPATLFPHPGIKVVNKSICTIPFHHSSKGSIFF